MIDWELADEVKMCTETAWRFAREKILPAMRDWETVRRIERAAHEAYAAIGLDAVDLPIEDGGAALGVLGKVAVLERLAVADPAAAIALDAHAVAYKAVADFANQAAIERILGPSTAKLRPDAGISVCVDLDQSLFRQANRITGLLPWVPGGGGARRLLIVGNGELLVLDAPFDHELVRGSGLVATSAASITLKEHAISERFASSDGCERFLAYLRLYVASLMIGQMSAAVDAARAFCMDRVAFGRPVAHHQAVAFILVDMHMAVESCRCLMWEAAWRADSGLPWHSQAANCFVEAADAADFVGPYALQLHGAAGFMRDFPVEKYMRDLKTLSLMAGGVDHARAAGVPGNDSSPDTDYSHSFLAVSSMDDESPKQVGTTERAS
ncbi:MAG: acyl-CoA dehydrogenase [Gammaproteobacteria bacterium]|jgi:hypothetical protein|nr:MAG: acyl-CoA dehydrogenase [Gammaproteobacteria bacterium]